jgi:DNA polymerase III delta subunit
MARVSVEVEKLIALGQKEITMTDVDELVYKDADYRIYEMTNAVARKNYSQFCEIMDDLKLKGLDENAILSSLLSYFKNALIIVTSDKSDAAIADMLKMKEYGVKKTGEQARIIGKQRLIDYVNCLYSQISDIKSGRLTPVGALNCAVSTIFFK